ncbi:MAG: hypothetical protein OXH81_26655 [Gemmatimonadetes bacterium]|nr:hypothetical protein [Gemmatimonadota bacterium]
MGSDKNRGLVPAPDALDHAALALELLQKQPALRDKISSGTHVQGREVPRLLTEVLRFLHLVAAGDQVLTPSHPVDLAWHEFILCTRTYGDFCRRYFGRMIHHQPGGMEDENNSQFDQTLALYQCYFGPPPAAYWLPGADCGACRSANP